MFASKRCKGSVTIWCATHARIHSWSTMSPLSLRESVPGAVASGQVWRTARPANRARLAAAGKIRRVNCRSSPGTLGELMGAGLRLTSRGGILSLEHREVRARPLHVLEPRVWDEEHVLQIVDEIARGGERPQFVDVHVVAVD